MREKNVLSVTQVVRNFADCVNRVAYRGEHFILVRGKKVLAELVPVPKGRRLGELPALLKSLPHLTETEARGFARDLSSARSKRKRERLKDPWES